VEIERLTEQARKQERELEEKDGQIERLIATIKKSVATIQEKKQLRHAGRERYSPTVSNHSTG
jgi:hypothetical protein